MYKYLYSLLFEYITHTYGDLRLSWLKGHYKPGGSSPDWWCWLAESRGMPRICPPKKKVYCHNLCLKTYEFDEVLTKAVMAMLCQSCTLFKMYFSAMRSMNVYFHTIESLGVYLCGYLPFTVAKVKYWLSSPKFISFDVHEGLSPQITLRLLFSGFQSISIKCILNDNRVLINLSKHVSSMYRRGSILSNF